MRKKVEVNVVMHMTIIPRVLILKHPPKTEQFWDIALLWV